MVYFHNKLKSWPHKLNAITVNVLHSNLKKELTVLVKKITVLNQLFFITFQSKI